MSNLINVYLGLGTNLGNRRENLRAGLTFLSKELDIRKHSSIYETDPWGYLDQPKFLNMVCCVGTELAPTDLLDFCKGIELKVGREPTFDLGPRVLDIDILSYGDMVFESPSLTIPHPKLAERAFVLVPLVEVNPEWLHPKSGANVSELLGQVSPESHVEVWEDHITAGILGSGL